MTPIPNRVARFFGALGAVALGAMMMVTVADIVLRSFFGIAMQGVLELVELALACTVFLGLPAVFLLDQHLVVDVVDQYVPKRVTRALDLAGAVVSLGVLAVMGYLMVPLARTMYEFGDVTSALSLPKIFYWAPVLLGVFASALATLYFIARWRRRP